MLARISSLFTLQPSPSARQNRLSDICILPPYRFCVVKLDQILCSYISDTNTGTNETDLWSMRSRCTMGLASRILNPSMNFCLHIATHKRAAQNALKNNKIVTFRTCWFHSVNLFKPLWRRPASNFRQSFDWVWPHMARVKLLRITDFYTTHSHGDCSGR